MRKLFLKISIVVTCALILSLGIDYLYRTVYHLSYHFPRNVFLLPEIPNKYEIVALGNSHAESGITFDGFRARSISLASVAQSYEYDYAMLQMYHNQIKKNAIIIISVSPLSFSQKIPDKLDEGNSNYYDGRLSPFLIPHLKLGEYLQVQIVPFVRSGYLWRGEYAQYIEEKAMKTYASAWEKPSPSETPTKLIPSPTPNKAGSVPEKLTQANTSSHANSKRDNAAIIGSVPSFDVAVIQRDLTDPPDPSDQRLIESARLVVNKWYHTSDFDPKYFSENTNDLEKIIIYCKEHNWRPVLVTLPISQVLKDQLGPDYMKKYVYDNLGKIDTTAIPYLNFSGDTHLTKNRYLFNNSDHLNNKGAAVVSYLILQKLITKGYIPKKVDGYYYSK